MKVAFITGVTGQAAANFPPPGLPINHTLVGVGETWNYDDSGSAPPGNWKDTGFNDGSWATGEPQFSGQSVPAVRVLIEDAAQIEPVALGVYLLAEVIASADGQQVIDRAPTFDLLTGTSTLRKSLIAGTPAADIVDSWSTSALAFDKAVAPYHLYGN